MFLLGSRVLNSMPLGSIYWSVRTFLFFLITFLPIAYQYIELAMTIEITAAELSHLPDSSIAFRDGKGFIAELAAYHELHCVVRSLHT